MTKPTAPIRLIIADAHLVVRAGLKALLAAVKDIEVVGEASNGREAVALIEQLAPDVAVLDLDLPQLDGASATRQLVASGSATRVLILSVHDHDDYMVPLLESGAAGYLAKNVADHELPNAVRAVAAGDTYVSPSAARGLARQLSRRSEHADERRLFHALSESERGVLVLVAHGYSASEIAQRLFINAKKVETHKQRIGSKLGLAHRSHYVQLCLRLDLMHPMPREARPVAPSLLVGAASGDPERETR